MEGLVALLAGLGVFVIIIGILGIATFVGTIVLLCLSIKEKGELKTKGIDEDRISKIITLAIWSIVISVISCTNCYLVVLPILAIVFANSIAKTALQSGDIVEASKKADVALIMLIIANACIIGLSVLGTIFGIFSGVLESL